MNSSVAAQPILSASKPRLPRLVSRFAWAVVLVVGAYFILEGIPRYLTLSEDSYGPYYWPRVTYLLPHLLGGLVAIVIGPFQFWSRIRNNYPKIHRISGRIYLISIAVGALGGMAMALTSSRGMAYGTGLFTLALAWLTTSGMAFAAIRKRNFIQHKQWMIRSYVVTFAFVSFRIVADLMRHYGIGDPLDVVAMMSWACWAVPLLVTELVIQAKPIFSGSSHPR